MERLISTTSTKLWHLASIGLTIGVTLLSLGTIAQAKPTPDLPITTDSPTDNSNFWVPVARLNTDKPQRITVMNKTGVTLEYLITTHTNFRVLEPGKSTTLSNVETPLFLNINPQESNYRVKYVVAVDKKTNTLNVNVILTNGEDNRTLNVNETGAVYLY